MTFSVGDIITGTAGNGYPATDEKCLCEVMAVYEEDNQLDVKITAHTDSRFQKAIGETIEKIDASIFHIASDEEMEKFHLETPEEKEKKAKQKCLEHYKMRGYLEIKHFDSGNFSSTFNKERRMKEETDEVKKKALLKICETVRDLQADQVAVYDIVTLVDNDADLKCFRDICGQKAIKEAMEKIINFFKEFNFEPSFRMINTMAYKCQESRDAAKQYVTNYFKVAGHAKADAVVDKIKSAEFTGILNNVALAIPTTKINTRLKVYYGSQGTGKTTLGMEETEGRCTLCNGSILPSDLLEDFDFNDGKPGFQGSILRRCLEEGKPIVLDEFNLLPFETVRFLQGILDGKKQFVYKGETIKVKDGFEIIATMNLTVGGMVFGLPEPLIDRCYDIREFILTPDNLMSALN